MFGTRAVFCLAMAFLPACGFAQDAIPAGQIDKIIEREKQEIKEIKTFHPIVETYIQDMAARLDRLSPSSDHYFLSVARFDQGVDALAFKPRGDAVFNAVKAGVEDLNVFAVQYVRGGFLNMIFPNPDTFDRQHYKFEFVRREFLGEVRCMVLEVSPFKKDAVGMFKGRIWVEDRDNTIVRYNGFFRRRMIDGLYFHFDSWRFNAAGNLWLPSITYSEESDMPCCLYGKLDWRHVKFRAQTRLWGYNLKGQTSLEEFSKIEIEAKDNIEDRAESTHDFSPMEAEMAWQRQAENNVLEQLERIGLLASPGPTDKMLSVVVNNLEVTNNLELQPEVRCRVLLTSRLESFVVGHTIVLSRGLIDVIPEEGVLASILAHSLAHIIGGQTDTRFAFADRIMFPARNTLQAMNFKRSVREEELANQRSAEIMRNSPYKDSNQAVSDFVAALRVRAPMLRELLATNLGESVLSTLPRVGEETSGKQDLADKAWSGLPLGSRTRTDPWSDAIEFVPPGRTGPPPPYEDFEFGITPVFFYLRRAAGGQSNTSVAGVGEAAPAVHQTLDRQTTN